MRTFGRTSRGRHAAGLAGLLALCAAALPAAPAGAAPYTVNVCATPGYAQRATVDGWAVTYTSSSTSVSLNGCPTLGYAIRLNPGAAHTKADERSVTFTAPADTRIAAYRLWRFARVAGDSGYRATIFERTGSSEKTVENCTGTCTTLGTPFDPNAANNLWNGRPSTPVTGVRLRVDCTSTPSCAARTPAAELTLYRAELDLQDDAAPVLAAPTGTLVQAGAVVSGTVPVTVSATDKGSGVAAASVEVDGRVAATQVLDTNNGSCAAPFLTVVPCKLSATGTLQVNTAAVGDGSHKVRVLVADAAGNVTATSPVTVVVANGKCSPAPLLAPSPFALTAGVAARPSGRARSRITVSYGRRVYLTGRLADAAGAAQGGTALCLATADASPNAPTVAAGQLTTNPDGSFASTLRTGPSRTLWVVRDLPGGVAAAKVTIVTRAGVTFRLKRRRVLNGGLLSMIGRVQGGPIPAGGVAVAIQARRATGWQTFKELRAKGDGIFRGRYRFTRVAGTVRFRLRAKVTQQAGYPYAAGASPARTVTVRGR